MLAVGPAPGDPNSCEKSSAWTGTFGASASTNPNGLVRIDRATGSSQLVGSTGLNNIVEGDLAYDHTTGTLYGLYQLTSGERNEFEKSAGAVKALVDACQKIAPDLGKK